MEHLLKYRENKQPAMHGYRLGVVIPFANEEKTIDDLIRRVLGQLSNRDCVFCVLDNASRDATMDRLRGIAAKEQRVKVIWAPENRCVVDAYFRGYREALEANCSWILEMDGGLSHLPEEIPKFITAMESGVDFAAGSRFVANGFYKGRYSRYALSRGGTLLTNMLLGTRMKDMTSGFECFTRRALAHVLSQGVRSKAHFFQTEIRYMLHDWSWREVPITYHNPSKSVGRQSVFEALRILMRLFIQSRKNVPEDRKL